MTISPHQVQDVVPITSYDTAGSFLLLGCSNGSIYYIGEWAPSCFPGSSKRQRTLSFVVSNALPSVSVSRHAEVPSADEGQRPPRDWTLSRPFQRCHHCAERLPHPQNKSVPRAPVLASRIAELGLHPRLQGDDTCFHVEVRHGPEAGSSGVRHCTCLPRHCSINQNYPNTSHWPSYCSSWFCYEMRRLYIF